MDEKELKLYEYAPSLLEIPDEDVAIEVNHVTKDYGKGRGLFDVSFKVPKGKIFGFCGTNGAGKTTTLRSILGFIKPDSGYCKVNGLNSWKNSDEIMKKIGYCPGEICFPPLENGSAFLNSQANFIGLEDMSKAEKLINMLQLDPTADMKKMSKGMKQKTALVASFMHSPDIILLDEPTTGLDPLMREAFINIIKDEKERGATILMSNHMFDELEETCDYVAFIKEGHIVGFIDLERMRNKQFKEYIIRFQTHDDYLAADTSQVEILYDVPDKDTYVIRIPIEKTDGMFRELIKHEVRSIKEVQFALKQFFEEEILGGNGVNGK